MTTDVARQFYTEGSMYKAEPLCRRPRDESTELYEVKDPRGVACGPPMPQKQAKAFAWLMTFGEQQVDIEELREAMGS